MDNNSNHNRVTNKINDTNLEYIKIVGLFGVNNVTLSFKKEVNIFIGENGLGKTTILNCVYYILEKKFDKLLEIDFQKLIIKFKNLDNEFEVNTIDIVAYNTKRMNRTSFRANNIDYLLSDIFSAYKSYENIDVDILERAVTELSRMMRIPSSLAKRYVLDHLNYRDFKNSNNKPKTNIKNVENLITAIDNNIEQKILYLTTYRRIENDFSKILAKEEGYSESNSLIQFGMNDVERSIKKILTLIRESSRESFNKMTGVLLSQYSLDKDYQNNILSNAEIDIDMAKIILDRLGNELFNSDKENIINLLKSKNIYEEKYAHLRNLVVKLIENYSKDKKYDDKIQKFANTCNKYLNEKEFRYNQSELTLDVYLSNPRPHNENNTFGGVVARNKKLETINLSQLSSGEKQIVSLFSKLYLESGNDSILIIDEPELSISMKWQKMLLPDIMRSDNCKLLLTVTHSPFIFENEFDMDAKEMRQCTEPFHY